MTFDTAIDFGLVAVGVTMGVALAFALETVWLWWNDSRRKRREAAAAATERARRLAGVVMSNHPPRVLRFPPPGAKR